MSGQVPVHESESESESKSESESVTDEWSSAGRSRVRVRVRVRPGRGVSNKTVSAPSKERPPFGPSPTCLTTCGQSESYLFDHLRSVPFRVTGPSRATSNERSPFGPSPQRSNRLTTSRPVARIDDADGPHRRLGRPPRSVTFTGCPSAASVANLSDTRAVTPSQSQIGKSHVNIVKLALSWGPRQAHHRQRLAGPRRLSRGQGGSDGGIR